MLKGQLTVKLTEADYTRGLSNQRMNERRSVDPGDPSHLYLSPSSSPRYHHHLYLRTYIYLYARRPFPPMKGLNLHFIRSRGTAGPSVRATGFSARAARTFILIKLLGSVEQPISYKLSPRRSFALARAEALTCPADPAVPLKWNKSTVRERRRIPTYRLTIFVARFRCFPFIYPRNHYPRKCASNAAQNFLLYRGNESSHCAISF